MKYTWLSLQRPDGTPGKVFLLLVEGVCVEYIVEDAVCVFVRAHARTHAIGGKGL